MNSFDCKAQMRSLACLLLALPLVGCQAYRGEQCCPTDIRHTYTVCGNEAVRRGPCGVDECDHGYKPTQWRCLECAWRPPSPCPCQSEGCGCDPVIRLPDVATPTSPESLPEEIGPAAPEPAAPEMAPAGGDDQFEGGEPSQMAPPAFDEADGFDQPAPPAQPARDDVFDFGALRRLQPTLPIVPAPTFRPPPPLKAVPPRDGSTPRAANAVFDFVR